MKIDFPFVFYFLAMLLSIGSLISSNLSMLGIGLLFTIIAMLYERKNKEDISK